MPVTIPDTITEWNAGAFCMSAEAGFGLSKSISLKAFQPFFVDLTLPYSVVRGEAFVLKATAFTYLQHCIRVSDVLCLAHPKAWTPFASLPALECASHLGNPWALVLMH